MVYEEQIRLLRNPENIREAKYANILYVLIKSFENEEHRPASAIHVLLNGGSAAASEIRQELENNAADLEDISLSCFAWLLVRLAPDSAQEVLATLFKQSIHWLAGPRVGDSNQPEYFLIRGSFAHYAAHFFRQILGLDVNLRMFYSDKQLRETQRLLANELPECSEAQRIAETSEQDPAASRWWARIKGISTHNDMPYRWLRSIFTRNPATQEDDSVGPSQCTYLQVQADDNGDPMHDENGHPILRSVVLGSTKRYNGFGFVFTPRRYWIQDPGDVDSLLCNNCIPVPEEEAQPGDIVKYSRRLSAGGIELQEEITTHTGRVWGVNGTGSDIVIRSKWGEAQERTHSLQDVPLTYGDIKKFYRQLFRLRALGALEIRSHIEDDNNDRYRCYSSVWWDSPDISVFWNDSAGAYDITIFVNNRNKVLFHDNSAGGELKGQLVPIQDVYVRVYWAESCWSDPSTWRLVPNREQPSGSEPHFGPFTIPDRKMHDFHEVHFTWQEKDDTGAPIDPKEKCIIAIGFSDGSTHPRGDIPGDTHTNNAHLVYPFDGAFEQAISAIDAKNAPAEIGQVIDFSLPLPGRSESQRMADASFDAVLTCSPALPISLIPQRLVGLNLDLCLGDRTASSMEWSDYSSIGGRFMPELDRQLEKPVSGVSLPYHSSEQREGHRLEVRIGIPEQTQRGSIYHLYLALNVSGRIVGGHTRVIVVV